MNEADRNRITDAPDQNRVCRRCNTERPLREFPRRRIKGGARQLSCVHCVVPRGTTPPAQLARSSREDALMRIVAELVALARGQR